MVYSLAFGLKTSLSTIVEADSDSWVICETSKVAASSSPLGTVAGVQLAGVFQSSLVGLRFQVALPAKAVEAAARMTMAMKLGWVFMSTYSLLLSSRTTVNVRSFPSPPS